MSELAKFVAATLQERVAVDLEEENKTLREEIGWREAERIKTLEYASQNGRVEITGKGGVPVYAHGEMIDIELYDNALDYDDDPERRFLTVEESTQCPIDKLKEAEIRLDGHLVAILGDEFNTATHDPSPTRRVYAFNPETHGVGGLWNNKRLELHVDLMLSSLLPVRFLTIELEAEWDRDQS